MIDIVVDYKHVVRHLDDLAERQIPFALAKSINATVVAPKAGSSGLVTVQGQERLQLRKAFALRRTDWADRSVKVTHFAKKTEPWATIGIHPPGANGEQRADIFTKFESDREKRPKDGHTIAVPVSPRIKRSNKGIISKRDRPRAYNFRQRTKQGVVALYRLVTRVELDPDLHFVETALRTVDRVWAINMERAFEEALRTAR
jgi:hypothetical protein